MNLFQNFIGGRWVVTPAASPVDDPSTGELIGRAPDAGTVTGTGVGDTVRIANDTFGHHKVRDLDATLDRDRDARSRGVVGREWE